jgi:hypothetical protein
MKKLFLTSFTAIPLLISINNIANGQLKNNDVRLAGNFTLFKKGNSENSPFVNRVNPSVIRNFTQQYKDVANEKWFEIQNGFVAMFNLNGIDYQVAYDKKGGSLHTIRSYGEGKLSQDLRHVIKSSYYDYDITLVQEIEKPIDLVTYIVQLTGKTELINLRISDGEMQVLERFKRSE